MLSPPLPLPHLPRLYETADIGNMYMYTGGPGESKRNKKYAALLEAWWVANIG